MIVIVFRQKKARRLVGLLASPGLACWRERGRLSELRVPRMPQAPPQVLPHLTLEGRLAAPGQDQLLRSGVGPLFWL